MSLQQFFSCHIKADIPVKPTVFIPALKFVVLRKTALLLPVLGLNFK